MQLSSEVDHHLEIPGVAQHGAGLYWFKFHSNLCQQSVSHDAESTIGFSRLLYKVTGLSLSLSRISYLHRRGETFQVSRDRNHPSNRSKVPVCQDRRGSEKSFRLVFVCTNVMLSTAFAGEPTKSMRLRGHRSVHFLGRLCVTSAHEWLNVRSLLPHRNSFRFNRNKLFVRKSCLLLFSSFSS